MRRGPALLIAVAAFVFWGLNAFDLWAVHSGWAPYASAYGEDLFAWLRDMPVLRKLVWDAAVACGLLGAAALVWRPARAGDLMLGAVGLMVSGIAWDLVFADGLAHYRGDGLFSSLVVIAIAAGLAWAAYRPARAAG
ncbi:MAG: hypothetical protein JNJ73_07390 [Hyphomonadaceae bacterium]|nr:hypothetical protein [Hyphomonadaceae bacterium]